MSITASASGLTDGEVRVTMTDPTSVIRPVVPRPFHRLHGNVLLRTFCDTRFPVPGAEQGRERLVSVFDLRGRLLYREVTKRSIIDLRRQTAAAAREVFVVKSQSVP